MSSFCGLMREYVDISLDRFDGENLGSTVYFLSHKHEDHMVGLSSRNLIYRLQSNSHIKLYCSDVTRDLLLADDRFTGLAKSLVVHELEVPFTIPVPDAATGKVKYDVTVTMVPAGHCPGSVMFLFEGSEGTALYTGDFRLARGDIPRVECLKSGTSPKPIDSLYIDTTFCVPEAFYIPSREDCTEAIIKVVQSWTALSPNHVVLIHHRAALGYEHLFVELAQHFNTKIHLSRRKFEQCKRVKALPDFGTIDGNSTQLHACKWIEVKRRQSQLPCGRTSDGKGPLHVKRITVSTMWFTQHVGIDEIIVAAKKTNPHNLRACYSFHSSYSEVRDVVTYLNPRRVFPNVIPMGHTLKQIQDRLNNFLKLASVSKPPSTPSKPRLLGKQRPPQKRPLNNSQSTDSDLVFDDSPRKPKKQKRSQGKEDAEKEASDELSLKWDASQSTDEPSSQPFVDGRAGTDAEADSSYVGSQRSNASAMDLVASDFDVTPKKPLASKVSNSTPDSTERPESVPKTSSEIAKPIMNGVGGGSHDHSEELFSDVEEEEDTEVRSAREIFKPFKDGSYGSHVSYASDIDLSDCCAEDYDDITVEERKDLGGCENGEKNSSKCQNGQKLSDVEEENTDSNANQTEKQKSSTSHCSKPHENHNDLGKEVLDSPKKQEAVLESSDNSISIEEEKEPTAPIGLVVSSKTSKAVLDKAAADDDDDDDDVIMLDSDEEGEVPGEVPESMSDEDDGLPAEPQPSTSSSKVQEVIDLTAEDEDDDIVSMGVRRFFGEEGDGYHGDSESEINDTDGIMTDSDGSFTKASYEKTKTRMSNGKSRRARAINGFSSSDSDSDTDVTIDESYTASVRYPIAGSCHYSKTRLNGFHSTLVDSEVIVLDHMDEEPPPNVTVVDIADKDKQAEESKSTLASAEDLVSGAMEMATAATTANATSRLVSTIQRLKKNINKPVLASTASTNCETHKQTARKSTSGTRFCPKKSPVKNRASSGAEAEEIVTEEKGKQTENETVDNDTQPSETAVNKTGTPQFHTTECVPDGKDSGKLDGSKSEQTTAKEGVLLR